MNKGLTILTLFIFRIAVILARAKNFKGLQAMAIGVGGFLIGSQIGIIMGAMASVRTIQSIPNFQRVINIVQEVRYAFHLSSNQRETWLSAALNNSYSTFLTSLTFT